MRGNGPDGQSLVTYAQNREDLYLYALLGGRPTGTYVDVGCNHEHLHSVTKLFHDLGWSGLNIDANPAFAAEFAAARPNDVFVNVGVGDTEGELTFRTYPHHDGLSTFDVGNMEHHGAADLPYTDVTVPIRTLDSILVDHGITSIDFLKIDVEGLEDAVLRGLDLERFRPVVIVTEAAREQACDEILLPSGYRKEFFDGLNAYYADDRVDGISIHQFAGLVLSRGVYTARELEALQRAGERFTRPWYLRLRSKAAAFVRSIRK